MAQMTNYLEGELSNLLLNATSYTAPTIYLALFTVDPGEAGTLTNECGGANYARQAMSFGAHSNGVSVTDADITFPQAGDSWGTISHFGIMDGDTEGADNMLFHSSLNTSKLIETDDIFKVTAGNITVTLL